MNHATRCEYLSALGMPSFLYVAKTNAVAAKKISVQCLVVENTKSNSFCQSGKTQDFLLKMLAAIDLKVSDVVLINLNDGTVLQNYNPKVVLTMGDKIKIKADFSTHHPAQILNNNALKRKAWEVLKQVQQCLK